MTLLLFADTVRSADLFHAIPTNVIDPFLYAELDGGRRAAVLTVIDRGPVLEVAPDVEVLDAWELGRDEVLREFGWERAGWELSLRACRRLGITSAVVPPDFPVAVADHLRAGGIDVRPDVETFAMRRRVKTPGQLAGMRRAAAAAEAAMAQAAELIRTAPAGLTSERVRAEMTATCDSLGCDLPPDVMVCRNEQAALGHDPGSGPIEPGDRVVVDIWPRDRGSRCWADMTRTFMAGGGAPDDELRGYWELCRQALAGVLAAVRPGVSGRHLYDVSCEVFEAAGHPTQRTKRPGEPLENGYFHSLGHGVGLEVHEAPALGLAGDDLVAGDVIAVEPGCYRQGYGGCRLEDLVLVTDGGPEVLTSFPYEL